MISSPVIVVRSVSVAMKLLVWLLLFLQHLVALRLELVARLPLGKLVGLRDPIPDGEKHFQIFARSAQVPIGLYRVGRLMIVVLRVIVSDFLAVVRRLADKVDALIGIERR